MTATMKAHANGSTNGTLPRKSLSSQIDRLDHILDGLDQALQGAITDAVKEAVSVAVGEAVKVTLTELVTNPEIIQLLRGIVPSQAEPAKIPEAHPVTPASQLAHNVAMIATWVKDRVVSGVRKIIAPIRNTTTGAVATMRHINRIWALRRPLTIAAVTGLAVGIAVGCAAGPWLAGIVSGVGAMGTMLGAQFSLWTKRLFAWRMT